MNGRYTLDKGNAKLMGVCAGFARWADADPTILRVGLVIATLFLGPLTLVAYLATGFIADNG